MVHRLSLLGWAFLLTLSSLPSTVHGQQSAVLTRGVRVRLVTGDPRLPQPVVGIVKEITSDTLSLLNGRAHVWQVGTSSIQRIEVRQQRPRALGAIQRAGLGFLIIGGVGGILSATLSEGEYRGAVGFAFGALYFGIPGAGAGAVVGTIFPGYRWRPARLPGGE
jgi:hypothetical protein